MMKISSVNAITPLAFSSTLENKKNVQRKKVEETTPPQTNKKAKIVMYSLAGLATVGAATIFLNNARRGKIKCPKDETPIKTIETAIEEAERKLSDEAKRTLDNVRTALNPKNNPRIDADFVDSNLPHMPGNTRSEMQEFYTEMAEKAEAEAKIIAEQQAKKEAMLQLKKENPQEYARLKAERAKAKRVAKQEQKAAQLAENTKIIELENGQKRIRVVEKTPTGTITRDFNYDNNTLLREVRVEKDKTISTVYDENSKFTFIKHKDGQFFVQKSFEKNEKGEYELISREIFVEDFYKGPQAKTVRRRLDGNTEIIENKICSKKITIRDKKGNIIFEETIDKLSPKGSDGAEPPEAPTAKILAPWYVNYLKLCKEYGVSPRPCGKGGAWDHFYELSLRKNDPEAYESYLRLRDYRANYDEKAELLKVLEKLELIINGLTTEKLTKREIQLLKQYVEKAELSEAEAVKIKKVIKNAEANIARQEQEELMRLQEAEKQREIQRQRELEAQRQQSRNQNPPQVIIYA